LPKQHVAKPALILMGPILKPTCDPASVNAFSKEPLDQVLKESSSQDSDGDISNQLIFNY